jgi:peptidoglycan hydrolase CwlO-like protein
MSTKKPKVPSAVRVILSAVKKARKDRAKAEAEVHRIDAQINKLIDKMDKQRKRAAECETFAVDQQSKAIDELTNNGWEHGAAFDFVTQ